MKSPNQFLFAITPLGVILLILLLMPVPVQATKNGNGNGVSLLKTAGYSALNCPAGVKPNCVPHRVGTSVVLCKQGDEVKGYNSISHYCLSCHANSQPMTFEHPYEVDYPTFREEFRELSSLTKGIVLDAGDLTCKTCHSGYDAENHFLVEKYDSTHICGHCHLTEIDCPSERIDAQSVCFPGRLNGSTRCVSGEDVIFHLSTSEFCENCHANTSRFHTVDVEYPDGRSGFTSIANLDPLIKLEDGRMTCESCHEKAGEGMMLCNHCHPK